MMKHYFIFPNSCAEFDDMTLINNAGLSEMIIENIGLVFDFWPLDDLFYCHPEFFCTERLKFKIEGHHVKFSGLEFEKISRISTGSNWIDKHPEARPGHYWRVHICGQAMDTDFGLWSKKYLVVSARAMEFLLYNHVTEVLGGIINKNIHEYFKEYEQNLSKSNYTLLPSKIFDLKQFLKT
jgi:hypothetical protein